MLKDSEAFSGFSVDDIDRAVQFYGEMLGLNVEKSEMGLKLKLSNGGVIFAYLKKGHVPATFTILNFPVDDIDQAVDQLTAKGVKFERYDGFKQDGKGIARGRKAGYGPDIAWFKDPANNILAVLEN